jgi:beta-galactosidase
MRRDGTVGCEAEVRTAGPAVAVRLGAYRDTVTASPEDVAVVEFEIVDSAGTVVPDARNPVKFSVAGASILALDNADLQDHDPYQSDRRRAFGGRGIAILRATGPGTIRIAVTSEGLAANNLTLTAIAATPRPVIPAVATP